MLKFDILLNYTLFIFIALLWSSLGTRLASIGNFFHLLSKTQHHRVDLNIAVSLCYLNLL